MNEARSTSCRCNTDAYDSLGHCATCGQLQQTRTVTPHTWTLHERTKVQLTPPPSQPSSPRRSYKIASSPTSTRTACMGETLTSALACQESAYGLFPPSLYQPRSRSASRRITNSSGTTMVASEPTSRRSSRPATPDVRPEEDVYAPMAAGFARMSIKTNGYKSQSCNQK